MSQPTVSRLWLVLAFTAIYFVWGTTYLASWYALQGIPPFIISALRYLVAGGVLSAIAWYKGLKFPLRSEILTLAISGILMLVGGSGLIVVAEQKISSGGAAVIVATEPLWFVLLDRPRWKLYFSNKIIITGLLVGFTGITLFAYFAPSGTGNTDLRQQLPAVILVFISCILWVFGTLLAARKIKKDNYTIWHTSVQLIAAGIFSSLIAMIAGEWTKFTPVYVSAQAWAGLFFLIVFGSLIAYLAFAWLVTVQPPAIVSTHTFVNPVIAVFVGWLAVGEAVTRLQVVALCVALIGVILTQMHKDRATN